MKNKYLLLIIIILTTNLFAKSEITLSEKIDSYTTKAKTFSFNAKDSLVYYCDKVIALSKTTTDLKLQADTYYSTADIYLRATILDSASNNFEKSLKIREVIKDSTGIGSVKNKIGYMAWMNNDRIKARDNYLESIAIHKKFGDKKELGKALNNLANLYTRWGDYKTSINLFLEALENYHEAEFAEGIAWLNFSIAILYKRVGEYDKSLRYSKSALKQYSKMAIDSKDSTGIRLCYNQLGFIYTHHLDSLDKGLHYQLEALRLARKTNINPVIADAMSGAGQTYYIMGKYKKAKEYIQKSQQFRLESGNISGLASNLKFLGYIAAVEKKYDVALDYYDESMAVAQKSNYKNIESDVLLAKSKLYEEQNNFPVALDFYKKYIALRDSIISGEIAKQVASTELKYEIEKKTQENDYLAQENKIQKLSIERSKIFRNFLFILISISVLILGFFIFLYFKQKQIKTLKGLIPICASCKKIRNDEGYYEQIEHYISQHSDADFSHGICPDCMQKLHPEIYDQMQKAKHDE